MKNIRMQINKHQCRWHRSTSPYLDVAAIARFHSSLPGYFPTPLLSLDSLAQHLGLAEIMVKDEAHRFGLNSFKVLGSSYAIAHCLGGNKVTTFDELKCKKQNKPVQTVATATDGNHGLGLAWIAKQLDQRAVVYMPKGSSSFRLSKIRELGAKAEITNVNYDDTVRYAAELSEHYGWILVQDTAWENYKEIPHLIMQGYLTIVWEYLSQCEKLNKALPTHVILQAGVGSFAGAIIDGLRHLIDTSSITFIIVEPHEADGIFQSGCSADGSLRSASGNLSTIMAGLSCGEVNPLAWDIIKSSAHYFISCADDVAAKGMRILGNPLDNDPRMIAGESGAVPLGVLFEICRDPLLKDLKRELRLNTSSRILFVNTEGATDPEHYRKICWNL